MIDRLGRHRADQRDVVGDLRRVRQQLGQLDAGLAALRELEGRREQVPRLLVEVELSSLPPGYGLPLYFVSSGLGSNRSIWLGPPCWNRQMTAFARAGIGTRRDRPGDRPAADARPGRAGGPGRASQVPPAVRPRNARRFRANGLSEFESIGFLPDSRPRSGTRQSLDVEESLLARSIWQKSAQGPARGAVRGGRPVRVLLQEPHRRRPAPLSLGGSARGEQEGVADPGACVRAGLGRDRAGQPLGAGQREFAN